jgi:hypothetical protein
VVLAIVLPLTLGGNHDDPTPGPPIPDNYNPYVFDEKEMEYFPARITGIIRANDEYNSEHHAFALRKLLSNLKDDHPLKKGINSTSIPKGMNNKLIKNLNFTFSQVQWRVSHLVIRDNDNTRFSIPK